MKTILKTLLALVCIAGTTFASADQVQLLRAQSVVMYAEGLYAQSPTIDALVTNLSPVKQLFVHLQTTGGVWIDVPMSYNRPAGKGLEIWTANGQAFNLGLNLTPLTFALKYMVNGQTYWDNNGGSNYTIAASTGNYLPTLNVFDGSYSTYENASCQNGGIQSLYGHITVRNIAYKKTITIVYSTDNWATTHTAAATYSPSFWYMEQSGAANPNQYGFEEWSYSINVGNATSMQYAVAYTVNGQTYWDNNFGQNYSVSSACS